jgi:hypothetical protein
MADTATASSITTIKANKGPCFGETARKFGQTRPSILWRGARARRPHRCRAWTCSTLDIEEIDRVWKQGAI